MENPPSSNVTVRFVVERTFRSGSRLSALLDDPIMEMPLERALRHKAALTKRFQQIPHIGAKTAKAVSQALLDYSVTLNTESGQTVDHANHDLLPPKVDDDQNKHASRMWYRSGQGFEMHSLPTHPFWLLQQTTSRKVFYLPKTIPSVLMTRPVWQAHHGSTHSTGSAYQTNVKDVVDLGLPVGMTIEIIIDSEVWSSLTNRRGRYVGLLASEVREQITVLAKTQEMLSNRVFFSSASFQQYNLSNFMLAEDHFLSTEMLGGFYVTEDEAMMGQALKAIQAVSRHPLNLSIE